MKNTVMNESTRIFTDNLKHLMQKKKVTQADMVRQLHISASTIFDWCTGNAYPRPARMQMLAKYFGVTLTQLTGQIRKTTPFQLITGDITFIDDADLKVGKRIHDARVRKSMTMEQLADKTSLPVQVISKCEDGLVDSGKTIKVLAKALDVRPAYIMGWENDPQAAVRDGDNDITLSRAQRAFVMGLRAMTSKQKAKVFAYMQQMLEGSPE